jgi:hypothetical protein
VRGRGPGRLLLGLCLAAAAVAAWGQGSSRGQGSAPELHLNPEAVREQMATSHDELVDVNNQTTFTKYLQAFSSSANPEDQQQIVSELTDYCVQRGLRPSSDAAELFLALALEAKDQGRAEDCLRYCQVAASFAPSHPAVHLAAAAALRQRHSAFSGQYLYEVMAAFFSSFRDVETRWVALSNLALWARASAFFLLGILGLLLFVQYQALLRHDVKEWLGGGESSLLDLAGYIVLFAPSLLFLAGYWWIIFWAGIFLWYARWPERIVTLAAMVLLVASGAAALVSQQRLYLTQTTPHVSNVRCYANRIGVGPDAYLASHLSPDDPQNRAYAFLLACRYLLHGSYLKAENTFRPLLANDAQDAEVHNNLGCIYFYENRYQEAIHEFSMAIRLRPDMASAYLNRSLAETKIFDFSGSQEDQEKARKLDPSRLRSAGERQAEEWGPAPSWMPLQTTRAMAERAAASRGSSLRGPLKLGASAAGFVLRPAFSLWTVLSAVLFLGFALTRKAGFFARACLKCGRPFCSRCKTSLEFESFCSQCVHLYIRQDGVSPEARLRKNYEVERFYQVQRIQRAIFSLAAPGAGNFLDGRPFSALFLLVLWCGLLAGLFAGSYTYPFAFAVPVTTSAFKALYAVVALILMVLLWVLFGLPTALRKEPPQLGRLVKG